MSILDLYNNQSNLSRGDPIKFETHDDGSINFDQVTLPGGQTYLMSGIIAAARDAKMAELEAKIKDLEAQLADKL